MDLVFRLLFRTADRNPGLNFMPLPYSWYQLVVHSISIFFVARELGMQGFVFKKSAEDEVDILSLSNSGLFFLIQRMIPATAIR